MTKLAVSFDRNSSCFFPFWSTFVNLLCFIWRCQIEKGSIRTCSQLAPSLPVIIVQSHHLNYFSRLTDWGIITILVVDLGQVSRRTLYIYRCWYIVHQMGDLSIRWEILDEVVKISALLRLCEWIIAVVINSRFQLKKDITISPCRWRITLRPHLLLSRKYRPNASLGKSKPPWINQNEYLPRRKFKYLLQTPSMQQIASLCSVSNAGDRADEGADSCFPA